jgi:predicted transport protein
VRAAGLHGRAREIAPAALEQGGKSVSYHAPSFFLEVLPRKHRLSPLLALDYSEVDDPTGLAADATDKKFVVNARYGGGVSVRAKGPEDIARAVPIIRQAHTPANA